MEPSTKTQYEQAKKVGRSLRSQTFHKEEEEWHKVVMAALDDLPMDIYWTIVDKVKPYKKKLLF